MNQTMHEQRRRLAHEALAGLAGSRSRYRVVGVQCRRGHHVAAVYRTPEGLVYSAIEGPRAHGAKDRVDTAHHGGHRGSEVVDLLASDDVSDDALPAWCDCGPWTLSRKELLQQAARGGGTVRVG